MRIEKHNERWTGEISNKEYCNILFDRLHVKDAKVSNTIFKKVHFKNCNLGMNAIYSDCKFDHCKFFGRYGTLGSPATYQNCTFINCTFTGLDLFKGQVLIQCLISGKIKNAILMDEHPKVRNTQIVFDTCNLSDAIFDHVNIYGNTIFRNTILPKNGLRLYRNPEDSLLKRAADVCSKIEDESKVESEVIFNESLKKGQDPIILDELFLSKFFKTDQSKEVFLEIVKGFEMNNK